MTITLRRQTPSDEAFLRRLILEGVALELNASAWPEPIRTQLLEIQYTGRRQSGPGQIIEVDGIDAGWVVSTERDSEVYLAEIMVLPELRGRGIGTEVIRRLLATGKPARLQVSAMNHGAIRLYTRLGFRRTGGDEMQWMMERGGSVSC